MTIESEKEASILRYHYVEKWPVGTIARELGVHHSCVTRVLAQAGIQSAGIPKRGSLLDPFLPFILETLKKHLICQHISGQKDQTAICKFSNSTGDK